MKDATGPAGDGGEPPPSCNAILPARVAILLATCNGEAWLAEQLDSIAAQTHRRWCVWASDDGSRDHSTRILVRYRAHWGPARLHLRRGPCRGFASNFATLACDPAIDADYFAFCDQDDLWEPDKLARALAALCPVAASMPALYCSRTRLVDARGQAIGLSPLFSRPPGFRNALVQNIGGGNTMVFNLAARRLLQRAGVVDVQTHDWWTYLVVSGCGGHVHYDPQPSLGYRQHAHNQVGMNAGWPARVRRLGLMLRGRFRAWNSRNIDALAHLRPLLTEENRAVLDRFARARDAVLPHRLAGLAGTGIYRQTLAGNLGLATAALLKKV